MNSILRHTHVPALLTMALSAHCSGADTTSIEMIEARDLHPASADVTSINATGSRFHGGRSDPDGEGYYAILWDREDGSVIDLHPAGYLRPAFDSDDPPYGYSGVYDVEGEYQAGFAGTNSLAPRAALWSGTAESHVDLHPAGAKASEATAIDGDQQAGHASFRFSHEFEAGVWSSTPDSFVNLHPAHASRSWIHTASGGWQGGRIEADFTKKAAAWQGTPDSFLDLHPSFAAASTIEDNMGPIFVGWIKRVSDDDPEAAWWSAETGEHKSLHPPGALWSEVRGTDGEHHVGYADFGNGLNALLWFGEDGSFVNLNDSLDKTQFSNSGSISIHRDGAQLAVGGGAATNGQIHAIEWIVTLRDTEAPAITDAKPVVIESQRRRDPHVFLSFDVTIVDASDEVDWRIEKVHLNGPRSRGRGHHHQRNIHILDDKTVRILRDNSRHGRACTFTATLRATDGAGNHSEPHKVIFKLSRTVGTRDKPLRGIGR